MYSTVGCCEYDWTKQSYRIVLRLEFGFCIFRSYGYGFVNLQTYREKIENWRDARNCLTKRAVNITALFLYLDKWELVW